MSNVRSIEESARLQLRALDVKLLLHSCSPERFDIAQELLVRRVSSIIEMYSVERPTNVEPLGHGISKEEDLYPLSNRPLKISAPYRLSHVGMHSLSGVCYPVYFLRILGFRYLFWVLQTIEGRARVKEVALMANTIQF
jgi:hypothetical protein